MGLEAMEFPGRTLTPPARPGEGGEGKGKRERGDDKGPVGWSGCLKV